MTAAAFKQPRRTYQPVRRDSYDVDDARAQVFRPIEGGLRFVDAYLEVFDEWADMTKRKGMPHELSRNCRKVLEKLLLKCTDFKTGVCEPCLDTLMRHTRFARATVVRSLAKLSEHHFVDWVRRTTPTENDPGDGPQVRQVSNAYFFDLGRLNKRVLMRLRQKLRKKKVVLPDELPPRVSVFAGRKARTAATRRERRADLAAALLAARSLQERAALLYPGDPDQQEEWLAMHRAAKPETASSGPSLNPPCSIKGNKE